MITDSSFINEFYSAFNGRILEWKDSNPDSKILPTIERKGSEDFTLRLGFFKPPGTPQIETNNQGSTVTVSVFFITPEYFDLNIIEECVYSLGEYFGYKVTDRRPIQEILEPKKIKDIQINDYLWQYVDYEFTVEKKIEKKIYSFDDFNKFF
jgi:hypothetical protein